MGKGLLVFGPRGRRGWGLGFGALDGRVVGGPFHVLLLKLLEKIDDPVDGTVEGAAVLVVPELVHGTRLHATIGAGRVCVGRRVPGRRAGHEGVADATAGDRAAVTRVALEKLLQVCCVLGGRSTPDSHVRVLSRVAAGLIRDVIGIGGLVVGSSHGRLALAVEVVLTHCDS